MHFFTFVTHYPATHPKNFEKTFKKTQKKLPNNLENGNKSAYLCTRKRKKTTHIETKFS